MGDLWEIHNMDIGGLCDDDRCLFNLDVRAFDANVLKIIDISEKLY